MKVQLVILEFTEAEDDQLMAAARDNKLLVLQQLLQDPRNPNVASADGRTPLHHAARRGHVEVVQLLLESKAEPLGDHQGVAPLHLAAAAGHVEVTDCQVKPWVKVVQLLLEFGADKDSPTAFDASTALHLAAYEGLLDTVRFLVDAGASKDQPDERGATALFLAAQENHCEVLRLLLEAGANKDQPTTDDGSSPLHLATRQGNPAVVRILVEAKAALDQANYHGSTPLFIAARWGHLDIVNFLLEAGASKDQSDEDGSTPLFIAAHWGHLDIVRALVEACAATEQANHNGSTPLSIAAQRGHLKVVQVLIEYDLVFIDAFDKKGKVPPVLVDGEGTFLRSLNQVLNPKAALVLNLLVGMTGTGSSGGPKEIEAMVEAIQESLGADGKEEVWLGLA
eukprot:Skav201395  [mRNA]  locus=scaffold296:310745:314549:+ [translate_table: standard]